MGIEFTASDVIAIVAIVTGGIATLGGVALSARKSKQARLEARRFDTYVNILRIVWRVMVIANDRTIGISDLTVVFDYEPSESNVADSELLNAAAQLSLIGSDKARAKYGEWRRLLFEHSSAFVVTHEARYEAELVRSDQDPVELENALRKALSDWEVARTNLKECMHKLGDAAISLEEVLRSEST